jgi:TolB-like protein
LWLLPAIAAVIAVAAGLWLLAKPAKVSEASAATPRFSMVVLPFANLSGDPAHDYLPDVITEGLTTALSRIKGAFIIARSTAFTYKGKPVDVRQVGKELDVRYALEGSTQYSGGKVRVNAQLIDAETAPGNTSIEKSLFLHHTGYPQTFKNALGPAILDCSQAIAAVLGTGQWSYFECPCSRDTVRGSLAPRPPVQSRQGPTRAEPSYRNPRATQPPFGAVAIQSRYCLAADPERQCRLLCS